MLIKISREVQKSVCAIRIFNNDKQIDSCTGFKAYGKFITNFHAIDNYNATHVQIEFLENDGFTIICKKLRIMDLLLKIKHSMPECSWDYAIFDFDWPEFADIPSLKMSKTDNFKIGQSLVYCGYPFGQPDLSIHSSVLASRFQSYGVKYLLFDASTNRGYSGGPLINSDTSELIGIITCKDARLSEQIEKTIKSTSKNVPNLEQASASNRAQIVKIPLGIRKSGIADIGLAIGLQKIRAKI